MEKETDESEDDQLKLVIDAIKEFLNGPNLTKVIDGITAGKVERIKFVTADNANARKFTRFRIIFEFATLICIVSVVACLGYFGKLDGSTVGTLIGSIIGYTLGRNKSGS